MKEDRYVGWVLIGLMVVVYVSGLWELLVLPILWYADFIFNGRAERQPEWTPASTPTPQSIQSDTSPSGSEVVSSGLSSASPVSKSSGFTSRPIGPEKRKPSTRTPYQ